ncbi:MAG TPA: peptidoglycan bridge formation glycyltransferase FemA/FemB family protein [Candidatus Angelobacter sp.]|jgi:lipid II:glycine glycyltransferase (peptidoglycan interpeptide bridge formation enzyme)|nr:peptidoglycan bridge formation glycyltransferase FemA/FemB family protein [Candidatus Angelobacter sp.]
MQDRPAVPDTGPGWDAHLLAWPRAHLLQSWGWGELQAGAGWEVERLAVAVGAERTLPLTALRGGAGLPGLPPRLYVPKGPACAPSDGEAWPAALAALRSAAQRAGASSLTVEPNAWDGERAELADQLGSGWRGAATVQPEHTAVVDLSGGEEAVLARMKPKGRYNIRLAAKKGVTVATPTDPAGAARELARLCAATASRQGINLPGAAYFERALRCLPTARVHLACVDGEAVSAVLVAHFAGEMIYLYGGSETHHRERQPSSALHAHVIREALSAGCDRYDLWGIPPSADPGHPWHGLRQFKLALGGVERSAAGAFVEVRRPVAARAAAAANAARRAARRATRLSRARGRSDSAVQSRPTMEPPAAS